MFEPKFMDPNLTVWVLPLDIFNQLNDLTPQSPIVSGPLASAIDSGVITLQMIKVAKPFRLAVKGKGINMRYDVENVVIIDEEKGVKKPIWVADAPDPAELAVSSPFFITIHDLIKRGLAKARYKAYIKDAEKIQVCGMDEPIGEIFCIPSGYVDELESGSFVEGTVFLEVWPRNALV